MLTLDVEHDAVLNQGDVMALSETWVDEPVPIQGFQCITHNKPCQKEAAELQFTRMTLPSTLP